MSEQWIIYHNPRCTKSRQALQLLNEHGIEAKIVEYLKDPMDFAELKDLAKKLGASATQLLRKKDAVEAKVKVDSENLDACLKTIAKHPELMERPVVVKGKKAIIARPPELVESLF